ncbi:cytochrome P450 9e2-like [Diorhabda sublineata]|uniref:cytochrome P450 9e2-like n=1 Tax=Diorhabda sublineata TaxID=1163346 RepID=UPI0024E17E42|nr:cytochrome P450 9e2-like [Diorhabda sublineata]XP_056644718.1 cytochrome P450 9e2-like [Diorhabda sublineata]
MLQLLLIASVLFGLFYHFFIRPMSYWKRLNVPQTKPWWFFGDSWGTVFKKHSFVDLTQYVYDAVPGSRYSGMYQFSVPTLLIKDPELIKQVCVKNFDHFTDHRGAIPEEADPLFGKNLFSLKGKRWRDMRSVVSPTFTSSKMKAMFILMSECGQSFTKFFLDKNQDSLEVEMKDTFSRFTNDVIATTAFGVRTDSLKDPENEFFMMGKDVTNFTYWKSMKFFLYITLPKLCAFIKLRFLSRSITTFFTNIIDETIKMREEKGIVRPDVVHVLMEARKGNLQKEEKALDVGFAVVEEAELGTSSVTEITNLDIAGHAMVFFFAGFDAVSTLMCFMCYELAINKDVQDRLREEIRSTFEKCNGKITYEALLKMQYMDMVVSESLRKWPIAVMTDRVCTQPFTIDAKTPEETTLRIDAGTPIMIPNFAIHRDPKYYPDPDRFDPERFNDKNKKNIDCYTYIPFGVGPRNCIGSRFALMEVKVAFFHILLNFELVPTAKTQIPLKISKSKLNITAEGGFWFAMNRLEKI